MKVLFVSHASEASGWGVAGREYLLALDSCGVDVVARFVQLGNPAKLPERVRELARKPSQGCDVVIQHLLPTYYTYNGRMFNVGMCATETSNFGANVWADRMNTMDKMIVFNRQQVEACRASGVTVPIDVVPHCIDIEKFQRSYEPLPGLRKYRENGDFLFYFIGEFTRRKNLAALLKAFHLEFDPSEPVQLVIKTNKPGVGNNELYQQVDKFCNQIKAGLKLPQTKPEIIVTERLTDEEMLRLHASCDVHVAPSYGEAWHQPCFDSLAMGRTPIATACTAFLDYLSDEVGWLVPAREEPVFGVMDSFSDLFTGHENWWSVDVGGLRRAMREAFSDPALRAVKAERGLLKAYEYDRAVIGKRLAEALQNEKPSVDRGS